MKSIIGTHDPLVLGIRPVRKGDKNGIQASFAAKEKRNEVACGITLFDKNSGTCKEKHVFPAENKIGRVKYDFLECSDTTDTAYLFFEGDDFIPDKSAWAYIVSGEYGQVKAGNDYKAILISHDYDWEDTKRPNIPYKDSLIYGLHVRGFTKHISSGVKAKGTFAGIIEKIPYLKELGVTAIDLQPCYEFDEMDIVRSLPEKEYRLNYWGYKEGYYYAPKSAYAFSNDAVTEFKDMVKACHRNGIEVFMQFYFPENFLKSDIPAILRHWAYHYQVDGFHFMCPGIYVEEFLKDPYLSDVKFINFNFSLRGLSSKTQAKSFERMAVYDDSFLKCARRYLKGDRGVITDMMYMIRRNPLYTSHINYFSDHSGFSMMDMVSYNQKHNEENGEAGRDGTDYNFSWNCGIEGETNSKQILALRKKQLKNAFVMLFLSQGTPYLYMGDEFGNSQKGNNNPYCQDNEVSWLNWSDIEKNSDIFEFVKFIVKLRTENEIFHLPEECTLRDYKGCGYPDISYHNENAWMPRLDHNTQNIAFMLCVDYASGCKDTFWYVAMNMDWNAHKFVLPDLREDMKWEKYLSTESKEISEMEDKINQKPYSEVLVAPRSIAVYIGKR